MKNIKTTIVSFLNEKTNYDDLFLGKTVLDIRDLVQSLKYDSITGLSNKVVVAMDEFESLDSAERFLKNNNWSVGRMQSGSPIGVKEGVYDIMKWRNLDEEDKSILDGVIVKIEDKTYILYFNFPSF